MGLLSLLRYSGGALALGVLGAASWQWTAPATTEHRLTLAPEAAPGSVPAPQSGPLATAASFAPAGLGPSAPSRTSGDPGEYRSPSVIIDGSPRLYPLTRNVWVRPEPSSTASWIGFLWFGSSVRLREPTPLPGRGCRRGAWYAIEPRGYVCVDEERATLEARHPALAGVTRYAPQLGSPWPHRYAESLGTELDWPDEESLLLPVVPRTLRTDRTLLGVGSSVAWTREQAHEGRTYLLTSDLKWVPKERVRSYPTSTFHGVQLGSEAELPLAFFRGRARPQFERRAAGFAANGREFARLSWVGLSGRSEQQGPETFLETRQPGVFVRESDAVVPKPAERTPWGTAPGSDRPGQLEDQRSWLEVSILGGWLLAYRGSVPVFATLVSAGRGGPARGSRDPLETAATPTGRFTINGKFATATMVSPSDLVHSEVPWNQNFSGPYALHAAYWHDRWGELASGGCINVSPIDGRWLYEEFTEPRVPPGWHGVRWLPQLEPSTKLIIHR